MYNIQHRNKDKTHEMVVSSAASVQDSTSGSDSRSSDVLFIVDSEIK